MHTSRGSPAFSRQGGCAAAWLRQAGSRGSIAGICGCRWTPNHTRLVLLPRSAPKVMRSCGCGTGVVRLAMPWCVAVWHHGLPFRAGAWPRVLLPGSAVIRRARAVHGGLPGPLCSWCGYRARVCGLRAVVSSCMRWEPPAVSVRQTRCNVTVECLRVKQPVSSCMRCELWAVSVWQPVCNAEGDIFDFGPVFSSQCGVRHHAS